MSPEGATSTRDSGCESNRFKRHRELGVEDAPHRSILVHSLSSQITSAPTPPSVPIREIRGQNVSPPRRQNTPAKMPCSRRALNTITKCAGYLRYLRIAWTVAWCAAALLLIALWARSYRWIDSLDVVAQQPVEGTFRLVSVCGRTTFEGA